MMSKQQGFDELHGKLLELLDSIAVEEHSQLARERFEILESFGFHRYWPRTAIVKPES